MRADSIGRDEMKMLSLGWLAVLLFPVGMGLTLMGFWTENPGARTSFQLLGLVTLGIGVWLSQRLLKPLTRDAQ
jgi:hypothetical protein